MNSSMINLAARAILGCLFLQPFFMNAQQKFNKFYTPSAIIGNPGVYEVNGSMNDLAVDRQTNDIYVVGEVRKLTNNGNPYYTSYFGYVGKLDPLGNPQWLKNNTITNHSTAGENRYNRLIMTSDSNLLALTGCFVRDGHSGIPNSRIFYSGQLMLHKMSKNGSLLIQKNYGDTLSADYPRANYSEGKSLIEAKDAANTISYVAAGMFLTTYSVNPANASESIFVVKTQTNLVPLWRKFYSFYTSGRHIEKAYCVYQSSDKNYVLTGVSENRVFIMKVNQSTGAVIWSHRYTISNAAITDPNSSGESITEDCNGNIIVSGTSGGRVMLLSVTSSGIFNWCDLLGYGTGQNLMKDPATPGISLGGSVMQAQNDSTFLLKFIPRNCNNNATTTYGNYLSYKSDKANLQAMSYKKMLMTPANGYLFVNEYLPPQGILPYEEYRFNIVSTDNLFKSSAGTFSMSEFCTPHSQTIAPLPLTPVVSDSAVSSGVLSSKNVNYTLTNSQLQQHTYCQNCPEPTVSSVTVHVKCHERVFLSNNCDGFPVEWFDENGALIPGANTHALSFIATQSTQRTTREYHSNGCIRCERNFEIIVDPPEVCFSLPATICSNQPIVPTFTCNMSKANWHQWVVTELNGAWNNRVVKGNFPSGGPPQAINIRTLWNGFIPGKCYGISLDLQDSCGYSNTQYQFFCVPAVTENTITVTMCPLNGNNTRWFEPSQHCSGAYYTFLGNDSRNYPYGYPLSPGSYILDCFDANGCQIARTTVKVVSIPVLAATTCTHTEFYCELIPNPEGILPDCPDCYRQDPRVELLPLQVMSVNGKTVYQRKIIDWDNCRECNFSFEIEDKACDFTRSSTISFASANPEFITGQDMSTSGSATTLCGIRWTVQDLSSPLIITYMGPTFGFTGLIGHTYMFCHYVTNCACGRECEKSSCVIITISEAGPVLRQAADSGKSDALTIVEESALPFGLTVKPNPSTGKFVLANSFSLPAYKRVMIHDMNGKMVFTKENISSGFEYDLSDLAKGVYVINVTTAGGIQNIKLVLQ